MFSSFFWQRLAPLDVLLFISAPRPICSVSFQWKPRRRGSHSGCLIAPSPINEKISRRIVERCPPAQTRRVAPCGQTGLSQAVTVARPQGWPVGMREHCCPGIGARIPSTNLGTRGTQTASARAARLSEQ